MTVWLKQSTAVVVSFGPFVDQTDGVTLETGLVSALDHASTGIFLSKNGGTLTIRHATVTASTYDAYGNYKVTLDTTDTNTLGVLRMQFAAASTNLPVWQDFMVVPANVWDSMFGADLLDVSTVQWTGTNVATPDTAGYPKVTVKSGTGTGEINLSSGRADANTTYIAGAAVSTSTAQLGVNAVQAGGTAWGSGAITSGAFATGAITATAIAADAIGASELAADAVAEIADAVWDEARSGHTTAGTFGEGVADVMGSVQGNVEGDVMGAVGGSVFGNVTGSIGSLGATAKSDVNAEIVDALATDTYAEPGAVPAATSSLKDKINWLFALARNKTTVTATTATLRNDADSGNVSTSTVSDDGTTFTRGEWS